LGTRRWNQSGQGQRETSPRQSKRKVKIWAKDWTPPQTVLKEKKIMGEVKGEKTCQRKLGVGKKNGGHEAQGNSRRHTTYVW